MIRILIAAALLAPVAALAQPTPQQPQQQSSPEQAALGQMVIEAAQREASLRAQLITAETKLRAAEAAKPSPPQPGADKPATP
jgi:type II secretory pathway pseudopilin PulG